MAESVISYQLDLVVRLSDTTTGSPVLGHQIFFSDGEQALALLRRDAGLYVLLNHGRTDMTLNIDACGYEPVAIEVNYERLDPLLPEVELSLIPQPESTGFKEFYTMTGKKPGLKSVAAVRMENPMAMVAGYVEQKQILKLLTAKNMEEKSYALLHKDRLTFEEITIAKQLEKLSFKLLGPLTDGWKPEEPLNRIVRGRVDGDGAYLIRVRDLGGSNEYMVRYETNEEVTYEQVDFSKIAEIGKDDA